MSSATILRPLDGVLRWSLPALCAVSLGACAAGEPGSSPPSAEVETTPPPTGDFSKPPSPLTTDRGEIYNVTIHTFSSPVYIDKLEVEFNRRKGIHAFYGFYRDSYQDLVSVSFRDLRRVDFLGPMPSSVYDQAIIGREDLSLRINQAFELKLYFQDGRQEEFFGFIPRLRGERDLELWEFSLDSNQRIFDYIEFDR